MIREAGAGDASHIELLMRSVPGFWDATWRSDVLDRVLRSSETVALVSVEGSRIIGFVCGHDVGFRGYLSELVVSPSVQGHGIGGQLLAELERRLAERGCGVVIADVWRDAARFYESRGWAPPSVVLLRKRLSGTAAAGSEGVPGAGGR